MQCEFLTRGQEKEKRMAKTATVQDSNGDVWTGRVVRSTSAGYEMLGALMSCGLTLLPDDDSVSVKVNGETHTGSRVK
jgi:hypothetical protein